MLKNNHTISSLPETSDNGSTPPVTPDTPPSFLEDTTPSETTEPLPLERSNLHFYCQQIGKTPLLSQKEEIALARRIRQGDHAAREHMIKANLRLVVKIAHDYKDFGLPVPDLISEGNIGLIKAIDRFDPDIGAKLSTYAALWIKHHIRHALHNHGKIIRLPTHITQKISMMQRTALALTEELGREPTDEELAMELQIPANKVTHLKSVSGRPVSLDAPVNKDENSTTFGDIINDEKAINPANSLRDRNLTADLRTIIGRLEPREAKIIKLRFGLENTNEMTLEEIGKKFNVTRERIRQLQNIALSKIRKAMTHYENQRTLDEITEAELRNKSGKETKNEKPSHPKVAQTNSHPGPMTATEMHNTLWQWAVINLKTSRQTPTPQHLSEKTAIPANTNLQQN
jgi:RNA polymerase primary sigma factor